MAYVSNIYDFYNTLFIKVKQVAIWTYWNTNEMERLLIEVRIYEQRNTKI